MNTVRRPTHRPPGCLWRRETRRSSWSSPHENRRRPACTSPSAQTTVVGHHQDKPSLERVIKQEGEGSTSQMHLHARAHRWFSCVRGQIEVQVTRVKRFMRSHSPRSTILWSSIWVTSFLPSRTAWQQRETRSALPPRMLPEEGFGLSMAPMTECLVAGEVRTTPPEGRSTTRGTCVCVPTERNFGWEMTRSMAIIRGFATMGHGFSPV